MPLFEKTIARAVNSAALRVRVNDIGKHILRKLLNRRCVGGKHTAIEHCFSGIPKHLGKDVRVAVQSLVAADLILTKPTNYGLQVSLNPRRIDAIKRHLED